MVMDDAQAALVEGSAPVLLARPHEWSASFYEHLFATNPELEPLFSPNLAVQREKFVDEIAAMLALLHDPQSFEARAARLGISHVGYGVRTDHYLVSGEALVDSVAQIMGEEATPELLEAWRALHLAVADAMLTGAQQSAAPLDS